MQNHHLVKLSNLTEVVPKLVHAKQDTWARVAREDCGAKTALVVSVLSQPQMNMKN